MSLVNVDFKIFSAMLANGLNKFISTYIREDKVGSMPNIDNNEYG